MGTVAAGDSLLTEESNWSNNKPENRDDGGADGNGNRCEGGRGGKSKEKGLNRATGSVHSNQKGEDHVHVAADGFTGSSQTLGSNAISEVPAYLSGGSEVSLHAGYSPKYVCVYKTETVVSQFA